MTIDKTITISEQRLERLENFIEKVLIHERVVKAVMEQLEYEAEQTPEKFLLDNDTPMVGPADIDERLIRHMEMEYGIKEDDIPSMVFHYIHDIIRPDYYEGLNARLTKRIKNIEPAPRPMRHEFDF